MQRMYLPVGFSVKPYPIPAFTASTPFMPVPTVCSGWIGRVVPITWDPTKTTISSSRLVIEAHAKNDPMDMWVRFNKTDLRRFFWGEGTKGTTQSDVIDVSIINGSNLLEVFACKMYPWIGVASIDIKAYIEITFEGETPERPWWEVFWLWLETNWPWIAIGAGLVIVGGAAYIYIARPKS